MLPTDQHEVEKHWTEYGILNPDSGQVIENAYASQGEAEFDALLYPRAIVVSHEVYETKWVRCGELPA